jgi:hypothetical protein
MSSLHVETGDLELAQWLDASLKACNPLVLSASVVERFVCKQLVSQRPLRVRGSAAMSIELYERNYSLKRRRWLNARAKQGVFR